MFYRHVAIDLSGWSPQLGGAFASVEANVDSMTKLDTGKIHNCVICAAEAALPSPFPAP
jgi:hypothetical protein